MSNLHLINIQTFILKIQKTVLLKLTLSLPKKWVGFINRFFYMIWRQVQMVLYHKIVNLYGRVKFF